MERNKVKPTPEPPPPCPFCGRESVPNDTLCPDCGTSIPKLARRDHRSVGVLDELPVTFERIDGEYHGYPADEVEEDEELDELRKARKRK